MKVSFLKNKDIDKSKWDKCLKNASNSLMYAYSWYLDLMAEHWDGLILNDYEAVMPLPWKQKYGLKYVYQPYFIQQLGVFSTIPLTSTLVEKFLKAIPYYFVSVTTNLNAANACIIEERVTLRKNYLLALEKPYDQLANGYTKDLKSTLKKSSLPISTNIAAEVALDLYKLNYSDRHQHIAEKTYHKLEQLLIKLVANDQLQIVGILIDNELIATEVIPTVDQRSYCLLGAQNKQGRAMSALHVLIDHQIKLNANQSSVFDFEGSEIESIGYFFKKFGATPEYYGVYHTTIFKRIIGHLRKSSPPNTILH